MDNGHERLKKYKIDKKIDKSIKNKPCKNHYEEGSDACSEMIPFCCPEGTLAYGKCRINESQCSKIGIEEDKKLSKSNIPKTSLKKSERILTKSGKELSSSSLTTHGKDTRANMLKSVSTKAPGCNEQTLQILGPFGADNIILFYEHELHVDPKYLKGIEINTLCLALNKAIHSYTLRNEKTLSLHHFLKNNIIDYLLQQIQREETSNYILIGTIPMDTLE